MGTFSVFYDGQWWVGVAERERHGGCEVARVVFGASEPRDVELEAWARDEFHRLIFRRVGVEAGADPALARNPKRRQREAARAQASPPLSTRAQAALAATHALLAGERKADDRQRRETERALDWEQRRARRKKRKRGH